MSANRFSALNEGQAKPREQRTKAAPKPAVTAAPAQRAPRRTESRGRGEGRGGRGRGRGGPNHRNNNGGHGGNRAPREGGHGNRRQFDRQSIGGKNNPNRGGANWGDDQAIADFQKNAEVVVVEPEPETEEQIAERKARELEILGPENKTMEEELAERKVIKVEAAPRASRNAGFGGRQISKALPPSSAAQEQKSARNNKKNKTKVILNFDNFPTEQTQRNDRRGNDNRGPRRNDGKRGGQRRGGRALDLSEAAFPKMG